MLYADHIKACDPDRPGYTYDSINNRFTTIDPTKPCSVYIMGLEDNLKILNVIYDDVKSGNYTEPTNKKVSGLDVYKMTVVQRFVDNIHTVFSQKISLGRTSRRIDIKLIIIVVLCITVVILASWIIYTSAAAIKFTPRIC